MTPTAPAPEDMSYGEEVERWQRRWPHWSRWQCELAADESWPNRHRTAPAPEVTAEPCPVCGSTKTALGGDNALGYTHDCHQCGHSFTPKVVTAEPLLADVEAMIAKLDAITSWGDMDEALKENADLLRRLAARKGAQIVYSPDAKAMSDRVKAAEAERDAALAAPKTAEPMELAMCEIEKLVLHEGQPYVFRRMPGCASCAKYGEEVTAEPVAYVSAEVMQALLAGKNVAGTTLTKHQAFETDAAFYAHPPLATPTINPLVGGYLPADPKFGVTPDMCDHRWSSPAIDAPPVTCTLCGTAYLEARKG